MKIYNFNAIFELILLQSVFNQALLIALKTFFSAFASLSMSPVHCSWDPQVLFSTKFSLTKEMKIYNFNAIFELILFQSVFNQALVWIALKTFFSAFASLSVGPVHCSRDPQVLFSTKFSLKLGPTVLFTHLKIILL